MNRKIDLAFHTVGALNNFASTAVTGTNRAVTSTDEPCSISGEVEFTTWGVDQLISSIQFLADNQ